VPHPGHYEAVGNPGVYAVTETGVDAVRSLLDFLCIEPIAVPVGATTGLSMEESNGYISRRDAESRIPHSRAENP
jgi:hypothetical protein